MDLLEPGNTGLAGGEMVTSPGCHRPQEPRGHLRVSDVCGRSRSTD